MLHTKHKQGLNTVVALHCLRIKSTQKEWSFQLYSTLWQNLQGNEISLESIRFLAQKMPVQPVQSTSSCAVVGKVGIKYGPKCAVVGKVGKVWS